MAGTAALLWVRALGSRDSALGGSGVQTVDGGRASHTFLNDFWQFDLAARVWTCLTASDDASVAPIETAVRPGPRYTPAFEMIRSHVLLFGGYTEDWGGKRKMNDLWMWTPGAGWDDLTTRAVRAGTHSVEWPSQRYGAMHASAAGRLFVCGGASDEGDHIDVWAWDVAARRWELLSADDSRSDVPARRYCAAFAAHGGASWLFGGRSRRHAKRNFNDTWRFDLATRRWEMLEPASDEHRYDSHARRIGYHAKAATAVVSDEWHLWGGEGLHGHVSDYWLFDFHATSWRQLYPARADDPLFW